MSSEIVCVDPRDFLLPLSCCCCHRLRSRGCACKLTSGRSQHSPLLSLSLAFRCDSELLTPLPFSERGSHLASWKSCCKQALQAKLGSLATHLAAGGRVRVRGEGTRLGLLFCLSMIARMASSRRRGRRHAPSRFHAGTKQLHTLPPSFPSCRRLSTCRVPACLLPLPCTSLSLSRSTAFCARCLSTTCQSAPSICLRSLEQRNQGERGKQEGKECRRVRKKECSLINHFR